MSHRTLRPLSEPYIEGPQPPTSPAFLARLGVDTPYWRAFAEQILGSELAPPAIGIASWTAHSLPVQTRVLISDYFIQCLQSTHANLVEASLHLLEWESAWRAFERQIDRQSKLRGKLSFPRSESPADDLPAALIDLHAAGFLRAIGSTLDCAAVAAAVVSAMPTDLITLSFRRLLGFAKERAASRHKPPLEALLNVKLQTLVSDCGPSGWADWVSDLRNVYVHRGRRIDMNEVATDHFLLDRHGNHIPSYRLCPRLPAAPERSDVEALRDFHAEAPVLPEGAAETMNGILRSTVQFTDGCGKILHDLWELRKRDFALVEQPPTQWNVRRPLPTHSFRGYTENPKPVDPGAFTVNPVVTRRMQAAGLFDGAREVIWPEDSWGPYAQD